MLIATEDQNDGNYSKCGDDTTGYGYDDTGGSLRRVYIGVGSGGVVAGGVVLSNECKIVLEVAINLKTKPN